MAQKPRGHNPSNVTPLKPIVFTLIEVTKPRHVGKRFELGPDGELEKSTRSDLTNGAVQSIEVNNLTDFAEMLGGELQAGVDVLVYGVPTKPYDDQGFLQLVTEAVLASLPPEEAAKSIARTRTGFQRRAGVPSLLPLDYDPQPGQPVLGRHELIERLLKAVPELAEVQMLWGASSGSHIFVGEKEVRGLRGQRLYLAVTDGSDATRAGRAIYHRLWLAGEGFIRVGAAGQLLERSLIDLSTILDWHVDFAAGACCLSERVSQRRPPMELINPKGRPMLDSKAALPPLTREEVHQITELVLAGRREVNDKATEIRAKAAEARLLVEAAQTLALEEITDPTEVELAERVEFLRNKGRVAKINDRIIKISAASAGSDEEVEVVLNLDDVVYLGQERPVLVRQLLEDPKAFEDQVGWCDPIEPDYNDWHKTGSVYPSRGFGFSFAHGLRVRFLLGTRAERHELRVGRRLRTLQEREAILNIVEALPAAEALDEVVVEAAVCFTLEGQKAAVDRILAHARSGRVATEFNKRLKAALKQARLDAAAAATETAEAARAEVLRGGGTGATGGAAGGFVGGGGSVERLVFMTMNADNFADIARDVAQLAGQMGMAYFYGRLPVRVIEAADPTAKAFKRNERGEKVRDENGDPVMERLLVPSAQTLDDDAVALIAADVGRYRGLNDAGDVVPTSCPLRILALLNSVMKRGERLPVLTGISSTPIWFGGELVHGYGLHEPTGIYLQTGDLEIEAWSDPAAAMDFLLGEWLGDFALEGPVDEAVAVCMGLSLLVAKAELQNDPGPPLFSITAPSPGIGKSLLADVMHIATTGRHAPAATYPEKEEEREKVITAAVMNGSVSLFFDNISNGSFVGNSAPLLTKLITAPVWQGRVLGLSKIFVGPSGLTVISTGNNVEIGGDLGRRVLDCRLVHLDEEINLARRVFRHDNLVKWTLENRGRILGAMQAILRHKPARPLPIIGDFHHWSRIVAGPVIDLIPEVDAESFYGSWVEAAETAAEGASVAKGMDRLMIEMAAIEIDGAPQPVGGAWMTAREVVTNVWSEVWRKTPIAEHVDERAVAGLLKRHRDQKIGGLWLRGTKVNLGSRTGRQVRWCFKTVIPADYDAKAEAAKAGGASGKVLTLKPRGET